LDKKLIPGRYLDAHPSVSSCSKPAFVKVAVPVLAQEVRNGTERTATTRTTEKFRI